MHGWELLLELVATLAGAFVLGAIFERLRINAIFGYLVCGMILGPTATGVVRGLDTVNSLAEIGVALVLFTLGLEVSWRRLKRYGSRTLGAGAMQVLVTGIVVAGATYALMPGSIAVAIALGAGAALSSTAVIYRTLDERGDLDATHGKATIGVLLFQDLSLIPLTILVAALTPGGITPENSAGLPIQAAQGFIGLVLLLILASKLLHRGYRSRSMGRNRDLPVLLAISSCVGSAWAAHAIGLSPSIGAFLAGMLLAETPFADQIRVDVTPIKTLFATLFFASLGMLVSPAWLVQNLALVAGVTLAIIALKIIGAFAAFKLARFSTLTALAAAMTLAQLGELSFVLLQLAQQNGILDPEVFRLATTAGVCSLAVAPLLVAGAPRASRFLAKRLIPTRVLALEERREAKGPAFENHFIIVGYGDAGQAAVSKLQESGIPLVVLEIDPTRLAIAKEERVAAHFGDATQESILDRVGIHSACALVVAVPDHRSSRLIISQARRIAPELPIVARGRYHRFSEDLRTAGATVVVDEEIRLGEELANDALSARRIREALQEERPD